MDAAYSADITSKVSIAVSTDEPHSKTMKETNREENRKDLTSEKLAIQQTKDSTGYRNETEGGFDFKMLFKRENEDGPGIYFLAQLVPVSSYN